MKKVKRKHQHNKSTSNPSIQSQTPDRLVQQDDLQKVKPKDNVELVQQEQDILSFYDSKEDDSIQLQGENADSKSLEQTILESLLEQDNQYEIKSEQNLEDDQTDNETSLETEEPVKLQRSLRRQALQVQKQKRFAPRMDRHPTRYDYFLVTISDLYDVCGPIYDHFTPCL